MNTMITLTMSRGRCLLGAAALSLTLWGTFATALAEEEGVERKQHVSYADLDLSQPEGVEALQARLRAAARAVCGGRAGPVGHRAGEVAEARQCIEAAYAAALEQIELPYAARRSNR